MPHGGLGRSRRRVGLVLLACALGGSACDRAPEPRDRERPAPAETTSASETEPERAPDEREPDEPALPRTGGPVRVELDLAARLVLRIAEHDPHLEAERLDARTIRIEARTADVTALEALCAGDPAHCEDAIDAWAQRLARPVDAASPESLAVILVPSDEVEAARASARTAGLPEPIVGRPWVEPFFLSVVSVAPDVLRQLEPPDLVALGGRDVSALEEIALGNLRAELLASDADAFAHEPASPEHAPNLRILPANDGLSTSRLLLVERWRELAGEGGTLRVAAPTAHTLLFTTSAAPLDVATLAYLARRMFAAETAPVSPAILRLDAAGWTLDTRNDRPDPERDAALEAAFGGAASAPAE